MTATGNNSYLMGLLQSELEGIVGQEWVLESDADRLAYAVDYYWVPRMWFRDNASLPMASFIVSPATKEQIVDVLRVANRWNIPVTPMGGGSGTQGGMLPVEGGILLDMKRMNRVIKFSDSSMTVTVETGIIQQDLENWLQERGCSMMHFPASIRSATLGGYLAHRGSGVLSTKYGKIEDMVISLEVILADGTIMRTSPVPRHSTGPDLTQLFVGAEGTFGIITEATMKIHPIPEKREFRAYLFQNLRDGIEAGRRIMINRLNPAVIRLYDEKSTVTVVQRVLGIEAEGAYMVLGFDGREPVVEHDLQVAHEICMEYEPEDLGKKPGWKWWNHQLDFFYPPKMFDLPTMFGTIDTVATFDDIEKIYAEMKRAVSAIRDDIQFIAHFSHWYDWGCMTYARFILDQPPENRDEALRLHERIWQTGVRTALKHGGMVNEHHGIGLKLAPYMYRQYGTAFQLLEKIKQAVDPKNLMNPGKLGFPFRNPLR